MAKKQRISLANMALSPLLRHDTQAMCGEFWSLFSHTKGKKSRPIQKAFCVGFVTWLSKGLEAAFLLRHDTGFCLYLPKK